MLIGAVSVVESPVAGASPHPRSVQNALLALD